MSTQPRNGEHGVGYCPHCKKWRSITNGHHLCRVCEGYEREELESMVTMSDDACQDTATCGIHGSFYSGYPKCPTCADIQNDARQEPVSDDLCEWSTREGRPCGVRRQYHAEVVKAAGLPHDFFQYPREPVAAEKPEACRHGSVSLGLDPADYDGVAAEKPSDGFNVATGADGSIGIVWRRGDSMVYVDVLRNNCVRCYEQTPSGENEVILDAVFYDEEGEPVPVAAAEVLEHKITDEMVERATVAFWNDSSVLGHFEWLSAKPQAVMRASIRLALEAALTPPENTKL